MSCNEVEFEMPDSGASYFVFISLRAGRCAAVVGIRASCAVCGSF